MVDDQLLDFVKLSRVAVSTARRVLTAQVTGAGDAGDDSTAESLSSVEVVQPLGLLAYPTLGASTEALIARIGDTAIALAIIDKSGAAQAVEAGEARLYGPGSGNAVTVVRIRASGAIEITSKTGTNVVITAPAAGTVTMQDGSQSFVRGNDYSSALNVGVDAMKVLNTAVGVFATATGVFATAVGVAVPAVAAAAVVLNTATATLNTAVVTCNAALDVLKASSSTWLSTKVLGQ